MEEREACLNKVEESVQISKNKVTSEGTAGERLE
jgi:hypothetical protein